MKCSKYRTAHLSCYIYNIMMNSSVLLYIYDELICPAIYMMNSSGPSYLFHYD